MAQTTTIDQHVQAELARRGAQLRADQHVCSLAADIDMIRRIALQHGMLPVATVAQVLETALGRGDRGPLITAWISVLRDAIRGDRQDRSASDSYAAACSVRLTG